MTDQQPIPRAFVPSRRLTGGEGLASLEPGTVIVATTTHKQRVPCAGQRACRVRAKVTAAGTLQIIPVDSRGTQYATGKSAATALVANTELLLDLTLGGEAWLDIQVVAGVANSTVTFVDVTFLP